MTKIWGLLLFWWVAATIAQVHADSTNDDLVSPIVNREIQVSVQAPWPSSPFNVFCEAQVMLQSSAFLEALASASPIVDMDEDSYERATQLAVQLSQEAGVPNPLLKLALTLRSNSPTCELHRGIALELLQQPEYKDVVVDATSLDAFLWVNGQLYTDVKSIPDHWPSYDVSSFLLPKEQVPSQDQGTVVILYANLGTLAFKEWYQVLKAKEPSLVIIVRHLGTKSTSHFTALQGYGVRLDIRNVEYKVFDERTVTDEEHAAAMVNLATLSDIAPHFLAGVNISAALSQVGSDESSNILAMQAKLWKKHYQQQQHAQLIPPAWQRRKLGLQAATVIATSATTTLNSNQDALILLQEVSQNLPSVASTLVHVEVPEAIAHVAESLDNVLHSLIQQSGGGLFINGKPMVVERGSFNVFEMLERLSQEQEWLKRLSDTVQPYLSSSSSSQNERPDIMGALEELQTAWMTGEEFFEPDNPAGDGQEEADNSSIHKHVRINVEEGEAGAVLYMNDVELDPIYQRWPTRLDQAMMAMQYGMAPSVRKNLFTMLVVQNPLEVQKSQGNMGRMLALQLMQGQFPVRLAFLLVDELDLAECKQWVQETQPKEGVPCPSNGKSWLDQKQLPSQADLKTIRATARDVHRLYTYVDANYGEREALQGYEQYFGSFLYRNRPLNGEFFSLLDILTIHADVVRKLQLSTHKMPPLDMAKALFSMDQDDMRFHYFQGIRFAVDKGLKSGMAFLNGRPLPVSDKDSAEDNNNEHGEAVGALFMEEQQAIFGMIMRREITDTYPKNIYRKILSKKAKNVFPKIHPLFTTSSEEAYLDWNPDSKATSLLFPSSMVTGQSKKPDAVIVIDAVLALHTDLGQSLAKRFIKAMEAVSLTIGDIAIAVGYRVLPSTESAARSPLCSLFASASNVGYTTIVDTLEKGKVSSLSNDDCPNYQYLKHGLPSENFLVANGRYYNLEDSKTVDASDIELLMSIHLDHSKAVTKLLDKYVDTNNQFDVISRATAFLSAAKVETSGRLNPLEKILQIEKSLGVEENPLRFTWNGDCNTADGLKMSLLAVVDPITESAQRLSPLLRLLRDELQLPLTVILAPAVAIDSGSNIPISSYYRFVADSNAYQGGSDHHQQQPMAHFSNLPLDHVLTVRMDVPEPWDIQQTQAVQDTDNLRCSLQSGCSDDAASGTIPPGLEMWNQRHLTKVEYGLEHLLFAGRCFETTSGPPNGLQLTLSKHNFGTQVNDGGATSEMEIGPDGTLTAGSDKNAGSADSSQSHYSDTVVMKTVGYWQLRANPGVWDLNILKGSRGAEIFDMMEGTFKRGAVVVKGKNENNNTKRLIMGDFLSQSSVLLVQRKKGYEHANLFSELATTSTDDDVVHVFSLATGHLYERLLKIMMLSVTKRTSSKVKFWLFENYLSPTFKASARAMAQKIGCEVEFVTYKWPEWLRGQTEKQRIIWGYKILFLDVLFPLNVKKIIYVDADQVVRGDLTELRDMDLQGAPYGYTPMCDSRESTIGYAFWRTGFWASHLQGRPYHISALYVVDLERFRKTLVGDQLRATYQQLSADPGSLANLDQDLPNFAQHQVPIFSLPQEWLWCESWCSDETKAAAKTIDLCNNPLHKEPKLSMAKRVISGDLFEESWEELDAEVKRYDDEYFFASISSVT